MFSGNQQYFHSILWDFFPKLSSVHIVFQGYKAKFYSKYFLYILLSRVSAFCRCPKFQHSAGSYDIQGISGAWDCSAANYLCFTLLLLIIYFRLTLFICIYLFVTYLFTFYMFYLVNFCITFSYPHSPRYAEPLLFHSFLSSVHSANCSISPPFRTNLLEDVKYMSLNHIFRLSTKIFFFLELKWEGW